MTTNLYAPSTLFNTALFSVNQNGDQLSWIGLANNAPINVTTTIPSGGSSYKYQVSASFGSGSADTEETVKKQNQFLAKIPLTKPSKNIVKTFDTLPGDHPYVKPKDLKTEKSTFESSGNVTGSYDTVNKPWPNTWAVYLSLNLQAGPSGGVYQFQVAADPETVNPSQFSAYFNVSDFHSSGSVTHYTFTNSYALNPSPSTSFGFTYS